MREVIAIGASSTVGADRRGGGSRNGTTLMIKNSTWSEDTNMIISE